MINRLRELRVLRGETFFRSESARLIQTGQIVGEVLKVGVGERMERVGHGRIVGAPAIVLVLA